MQQAWHIFKKDALSLRLEILNYLAAILAAVWLARFSSFVAVLLVRFTSAYLIAGLIHADAPAGDHQFWVTRPYRWQSLTGAKLIFILLIIDLPDCLFQWAFLMHEAFPFAAVWRGLFWEQFLLFFGVYLPLAALAALTTGLVSFLSFALVAGLVETGIDFLLQMPHYSLRASEWVRSSLGFVLLMFVSALIVCRQYKSRYTVRNRLVTLCLLVPGVIAYIFVPWSAAFAVQQHLSSRRVDPSSLRLAMASQGEKWGLAMSKGKRIQISLPVTLQGFPADSIAVPEVLEITVQSSGDGSSRRLESSNLSVRRNDPYNPGSLVLTDTCELDRDFFDHERQHPVSLRGSLFVTLFGNIQTHTIYQHWPDRPIAVTDSLRCYFGPYGMICDSPFRLPDQMVTVQAGASAPVPLSHPMSYSPFPASLRFSAFETSWAGPRIVGAADYGRTISMPDLTVHVAEPIAYLRRDFEIRDVRLTDIAVPWRSRKVNLDGKTILENEY